MLTRVQLPILAGVRMLLIVGFGGLLGLFALATVYTLRTLERVDALDDSGTDDYLQRSQALQEIRHSSARVALCVRDYVLDPDPAHAAQRREQAERAWAVTLDSLAAYRRIAAPESQPAVDALAATLRSYWAAASEIVAMNDERRGRSYEILARRLGPLRDDWSRALENVDRLDQQRLRSSILDGAALIEQSRNRLTIAMAIVLVLSVALALVSIVSLFRLERTARERYDASLRDREELEKLSNRLVEVQEEERRRIARELHDEVGQALSALLVDAGHARNNLISGESDLRDRLDSIKRLGESTLAAVRNLCLLLRPSMLDDLGLVPALEWQARETSRRTGIRVDLDAPDDLDLPDSHRTAIYRVVQEALHNVARHSGARHVQVFVRRSEGQILVVIQDDGVGFDPKCTRGVGLLGMEERVVHLNGQLRVESEPGRGAVVRVEIPLCADPESALSPALLT